MKSDWKNRDCGQIKFTKKVFFRDFYNKILHRVANVTKWCLFEAASFCNISFCNISQNLSFNTIEDANKMQCFFFFPLANTILNFVQFLQMKQYYV